MSEASERIKEIASKIADVAEALSKKGYDVAFPAELAARFGGEALLAAKICSTTVIRDHGAFVSHIESIRDTIERAWKDGKLASDERKELHRALDRAEALFDQEILERLKACGCKLL